jgi:hypothetical protein
MIAMPIEKAPSVGRGRRLAWQSVAVVCAGAVMAGCSSSGYVENTYPITPGHFNHAVPIGRGQLGPNTWTLSAEQDGDGQLCMGLTWRPAALTQGLGCGFGSNQVDDEGRGTQPTTTEQAKDGSVLTFGPSPAGAIHAVLSMPTIPGTGCKASTLPPTTVAITHRLPAWYPVRGTGWFATQVPPAAFTCVIDVQFLDAKEHPVKQPNNF